MKEFTVKNYIFVLGATDNEMAAIELLLTTLDYPFIYASIGDKRVNSSNANAADAVHIPTHLIPVFVECRCKGTYDNAVIVDHHQEGDPGFGKPPAQYWEGSSIGQVANLIDILQNREMSLYAAADHCLTDAYLGNCPGISKADMKYFRVSLASQNQKKPMSLVVEQMSQALIEMQSMPKITIGETQVVNARGRDIPMASEAAASEAIAYLYDMQMKDGRVKVGLLNAPPEVTRLWMKSCGLDEVYGDPNRRFAGGYINPLVSK